MQETQDDAQTALIEALVASDLNRKEAVRLAQEKPDECRRQLTYLPYRTGGFTSSRGAYLRSAIQDGFAAPPGYHDAQQQRQRSRQTASSNALAKARSAHYARHQDAYRGYLEETQCVLREDLPDLYAAFLEAEADKRKALLENPVAAKPGLRTQMLADHDSARCYSERLVTFFRQYPESAVLDFWEWDAQWNAERFQPPS